MISKKLLNLIINNEDRLAKRWCEEVRKTEYMKTYQRFSEDELIKRTGIMKRRQERPLLMVPGVHNE